MNRDERAILINEFMETAFAVNIRPRRIQEDLWGSMIALTEGADHHRPFGYSVPQFLAYDNAWVFFYSPEVIADTTAELFDDELGNWLRYIRAHISTHTSLGSYCDESIVDERVMSVMPEVAPLIARVYDTLFVF